MAFTLQAIVGTQSINLTNGNPYSLVSARGMGGAPVRRVTARGPAQHGDSDLGYRLNPREVELVIGIQATTDAQLDGYRDALMSVFKPLQSTPVVLRVTRDDGEVRQLDCYTIGNVTIDLVPEYRPGHYHRATVRLYAPDPAYYNPAAGSAIFSGTASALDQWWLAGGAIGTAQVLEYGTYPSQGQQWTYTGTLTPTPSYIPYFLIAIRTAKESLSNEKFLFFAGSVSGNPSFSFSTYGTGNYVIALRNTEGSVPLGNNFMLDGYHNYFFSWSKNPSLSQGISYSRDDEGAYSSQGKNWDPFGTARRWRSDATNSPSSRWEGEIEKYAIYKDLSRAQELALNVYMTLGSADHGNQQLNIPYDGDTPEYPTMSIRGPVTNPKISNLTTGEVLDFGTISIGAGTVYTIDLRYGQKSVLMGTVSKNYELALDSDLATFHLAPDPLATGGTNILRFDGTAMSGSTQFTVTYHDRYLGF